MKRHKHSLSHYKLMSMDMGELIPIGLMEVLPGDTFQHATSALIRAAPMLAPVMHPVHAYIRHFFVPHRLVWRDWEDFITGGPDGMNASAMPNRTFNAGECAVGTLPHYYGVRPHPLGQNVAMLALRGYAMIYNEWFRDEDLQPEIGFTDASGVDGVTNISMKNVNWEKDYFTSARPWEQKGPQVNVPIITNNLQIKLKKTTEPGTDRDVQIQTGVNPSLRVTGADSALAGVMFGTQTGLQANLLQLREAFAIQRYEEARARYGSRYTEYLRYLGVRSSDARLQRPEYLGGGRQTIQFSEVLQTAPGTDPVGDLKGHGIGSMQSNRYRRFFEEHGFIHSFIFIRPKSMYVEGMDRHWLKRTKEDFYQPEYAHIGQQEIFNTEVFGGHSQRLGVFGYQDRYEEYRRVNSSVGGEFSSTLEYWHMARSFTSDVALNSAFVTANPTERTFAVPAEDAFMVMAYHNVQARRMVTNNTRSYVN